MQYMISTFSKNEHLPEEMLQLYTDAFPSDERRPWKAITDVTDFMSEHPEMHMLLMRNAENSFAGFMIYWTLTDKVIYVEHLATLPSLRGNGLGAMLISELTNRTDCQVLLEVEPPADEMTRRRIGFYQRQNFVLHKDLPYRQPPYSPEKQAIDLCIMSTPGLSDEELASKIIPQLHRLVYGVQ